MCKYYILYRINFKLNILLLGLTSKKMTIDQEIKPTAMMRQMIYQQVLDLKMKNKKAVIIQMKRLKMTKMQN